MAAHVFAASYMFNMPTPIYKAFIPELCAAVAVLIKSPFIRSRDPNGQFYWTGYIYWCTLAADERGNLQKQWVTSRVECSFSNNELGGGFDHVCVVDGRVMFYDFIFVVTGKVIGCQFGQYLQSKQSIVKCSAGAACMFWCQGSSDVSEDIGRRRKVYSAGV